MMKIMLGQGLGYALLGLVLKPWMVMVLVLLIGTSFGIVNNYVQTTIQLRIAGQMRGRSAAMMTTFIFCLSPIAFCLAGIVVEAVPRLDLLIVGCGLLVAMINFLACQERQFRSFLTSPLPTEGDELLLTMAE
jgi:uncharacterized membrane protein YhaH (DUF805 family)